MTRHTKWQEALETFDGEELHADEPDVQFVVEDWMEDARDALGRWDISRKQPKDEEGYFRDVAKDGRDLLETWGGLVRLRPELVDDHLIDDVARHVAEDAELLIELVARLKLLDGWLEKAERWEYRVLDGVLNEREQARGALELLRRLDGAELVAHAIETLSHAIDEDRTLEVETNSEARSTASFPWTGIELFTRWTSSVEDVDMSSLVDAPTFEHVASKLVSSEGNKTNSELDAESTDDTFGTAQHELEEAVSWLAERPEMFTEASRYVRPSLAAFRADLEDKAPGLALTQIKFLQIAEAIEEERRWLQGEHVEPVDADFVESWLDETDSEASSNSLDFPSTEETRRMFRNHEPRSDNRSAYLEAAPLPEYEPVDATGASPNEGEATYNEGKKLTWFGPDESWRAIMRLPEALQASDDCEVTLKLQQYPEAIAIQLFGLDRILDDEGFATFTMGELREVWNHDDRPSLAVFDEENTTPEFGRLKKT